MTIKAASAHAIHQEPGPPGDLAPEGQSRTSMLSTHIESLLGDVWKLVHDHLLLVALESQRAGRNLMRMVFAAIVAAVLFVTGWLAFVAAAMFWIVADDASWARAFLTAGLLHAAISIAIVLWIRNIAGQGMFSATLRQLRSRQKPEGSGE
jgi:uncharacterized membrane protein YqjE